MKLKVVVGKDREVNRKVIYYAAQNTPSIIVDCANVADPHRFFPRITEDQFENMYVYELEVLYKFRDVLTKIPEVARIRRAKTVVVTTSHHLMNYQDEKENTNIYDHSWELLLRIGRQFDTLVAVVPGTVHEIIARSLESDIQLLQEDKWLTEPLLN